MNRLKNLPMKVINSIYDIEVLDAQKVKHSLSEFKGKVLLIVNVASQCGLAKQSYAELSSLLDKYYNRGLRILLFPCRQFLAQEYCDINKVKDFINEYNKDFILMDMVNVNGKNRHPLYEYLCSNLKGFLTNHIKWNFTYFLIGRNGELVRRYSPTEHIKENDADILRCIGDVNPQEINRDFENPHIDYTDMSSDN